MTTSPSSRPARRALACAATLVLALVAGACSAPPKQQTPVEDVPTASSTGTGETGPEGFEEFYGQTLAWEECGAGWECTTARAPLSWQEPAAGEIELAVKRQPATGERIGSLLTNPGGPGASGVDFVESLAPTVGESVTAAYDLVGFDPRGVGQSSPVVCLDDAAKDESLSRDFDTDEAGLEALAEDRRAWADACAENTGELLGQVDTQSAARDMDMLRAVLGDEKLAYLGYSYGTQLGATYAGLFPDKVGRMVLDGAIDTSLDPDEISEQQAVGFENALRAYVEDCQAGAGCPLKGDTDAGMRQIRSLLDAAKANPLPTDSGRSVTQTLGFYGVAVTLYNDQSWPVLTQALTEAFEEGTGNGLLYLADFYNDRNADGTYSSNSSEAFRAVNCLDGRQDDDPAAMQAQLERLEEEAPTMGYFFAFGGLTCEGWAYPVVDQEFDLAAEGAAPILVIGTTNDPATPYVWAEGLADTLDSAVLVTWEGEGHTAYGRANDCLSDAVDAYLVDGTVPEDGLRC
ncbi:alpha/beta hydrolase [Cellulosimicrobium cellulans]|uniref:alpha/beta hydrolase n=1 Tax=Cellulosimicrobium cellulans TaxID=1710 RepID=UPI001BABF3E9|nr:alpha/beta hydrolase [Cellulosimicrobium cellulans]QUB98564.1 alpha/beta fold hydrolase [Cellulosimicrobium cellulans]